ncbi:astacin-like metalloendopeptidase [Rana temporaria]|uniref:astacin-like metalloendopeptidase n=1 Tax=Rana temporaria TaxID=8407 RepID=UPI001AADB69C|nr:astacin-like metalloendopeptidase [Rana temporaria]
MNLYGGMEPALPLHKMINLLLAICLLGTGGVTGAVFTTGLPTSTAPVDDILQINQRLVSEDHLGSKAYFEGDILLTSSSFSPDITKWVKKDGIVQIPYVLDPSYMPDHIQTMNEAFSDFQATTCIRFVKRTDQRDYISILPGLGCYSAIGRKGRRQVLSLNFDCLAKGKGTVLHELLHVLGFWHEHSRADRDNYIRIDWEAIQKGYERNFCKYDTTNMIVNYTLGSILHYSGSAFANNEGSKTIVPRTKAEIGQRMKLHKMDILRVNKLYCTEPKDFSLEVSAPVIYDCSPENTKQDANTELSTGPASVLTFREESGLFLTPNFSATQAPTSTSSITQEKNSSTARSISANHETEVLPAPNSSASQKPGPSLDSNSLTTQEAEHSPAPTSIANCKLEHSPTSTLFANESPKRNPAFTSSTSEGFNLSPNTSAIQEAEFGSAVSSFITQKSKIASFASSISVLTGGPKKSLLLNPVSAYASSAEIRQNIFDTSSQIVSGRPPLWPVTHTDVKRTLFNTQTTTFQTFSSKTRMSLIASSLATSTLKGRTKELLSTSITNNTDQGSGLFYSQEGPGTTTTIQEAGYTHLILPTTETKSTINTSVTAVLKTLSRSASQISDAATQTIVHHTALEKAMSSFIFQSTGIPEQTGTKDVANLPDDREGGHLKAELLKILGKRSSPDSGETTVGILKEIQPRKNSVLKSLHEMFYHGRPLATTIKLESLCGFEAGMCGWKQIIDDDLDWSLASGSVNVDTGHLNAGGFHLLLYSHQRNPIPQERAILVRPITQSFSCISFWYGGYQHTIMGTLNIYIASNSGKKTLLWSVGGQQRLRWTKAQIDFQPQPQYHNVQVVVEGVVDPVNASTIAIDNLYIGNCS